MLGRVGGIKVWGGGGRIWKEIRGALRSNHTMEITLLLVRGKIEG